MLEKTRSTRIDGPRPISTYIIRAEGAEAALVRHWEVADALACRRCEECIAYNGEMHGLVTCAIMVQPEELARHCFG